jgi:hypothetical protein
MSCPLTVEPTAVHVEPHQTVPFELWLRNPTEEHFFTAVIQLEAEGVREVELGRIEPDPGPIIRVDTVEIFFGVFSLTWMAADGNQVDLLCVSYVPPQAEFRLPMAITSATGQPNVVSVSVVSCDRDRRRLRLRKSLMLAGQTEALVLFPLPDGTAVWAGLVL